MKTLQIYGWAFATACLMNAWATAAATTTFFNNNSIVIHDGTNAPTPASAYPSTIAVSGLGGSIITRMTVTLSNISHEFPDDVDVLLVGPQGQQAMIMSNVGGDIREPATNVTLILDDDAAQSLPFNPPLVSGTFKPTKRLATLTFPFPAPAPAGNESAQAPLSIYKGSDPSGVWKLFIVDDAYPDAGVMAGGWHLTITTTPLLLWIEAAGTNVVLSWTNPAAGYTLQTTPNLGSSWTNALPPAVIVSGRYTVTNPISSTSRFYRLAK
jgi:subtilisin-like proprotein convertase family protein